MNNRYFACAKCKKFTSAGYRWAFWSLEHTGIVEMNSLVSVANILNANEYWFPTPDEHSTWLCAQVLPLVKDFLKKHADHGVHYVESGEFFGMEDFDSWMELSM